MNPNAMNLSTNVDAMPKSFLLTPADSARSLLSLSNAVTRGSVETAVASSLSKLDISDYQEPGLSELSQVAGGLVKLAYMGGFKDDDDEEEDDGQQLKKRSSRDRKDGPSKRNTKEFSPQRQSSVRVRVSRSQKRFSTMSNQRRERPAESGDASASERNSADLLTASTHQTRRSLSPDIGLETGRGRRKEATTSLRRSISECPGGRRPGKNSLDHKTVHNKGRRSRPKNGLSSSTSSHGKSKTETVRRATKQDMTADTPATSRRNKKMSPDIDLDTGRGRQTEAPFSRQRSSSECGGYRRGREILGHKSGHRKGRLGKDGLGSSMRGSHSKSRLKKDSLGSSSRGSHNKSRPGKDGLDGSRTSRHHPRRTENQQPMSRSPQRHDNLVEVGKWQPKEAPLAHKRSNSHGGEQRPDRESLDLSKTTHHKSRSRKDGLDGSRSSRHHATRKDGLDGSRSSRYHHARRTEEFDQLGASENVERIRHHRHNQTRRAQSHTEGSLPTPSASILPRVKSETEGGGSWEKSPADIFQTSARSRKSRGFRSSAMKNQQLQQALRNDTNTSLVKVEPEGEELGVKDGSISDLFSSGARIQDKDDSISDLLSSVHKFRDKDDSISDLLSSGPRIQEEADLDAIDFTSLDAAAINILLAQSQHKNSA